MSHRRLAALAAMLLIAALSLSSTGCSYMTNRGKDLAEFLDAGITVSSKPQFALYAGFLNILDLGYSNVDGTLLGTAGPHFGAIRMRQDATGLLLWGKENFCYAPVAPTIDFDMFEHWKVGLFGLTQGPPPPASQTVNCPKLIHLGWIGITVNCKFGELADFVLGLATIDIMHDDGVRWTGCTVPAVMDDMEPETDAGDAM